ncbi:hypothetical protein MRX96_017844 [Rhipicephalus microplus]
MICTNMKHIRVIEREGFLEFVNVANPGYKLPSRDDLREVAARIIGACADGFQPGGLMGDSSMSVSLDILRAMRFAVQRYQACAYRIYPRAHRRRSNHIFLLRFLLKQASLRAIPDRHRQLQQWLHRGL